jgi:hypothetical protein
VIGVAVYSIFSVLLTVGREGERAEVNARIEAALAESKERFCLPSQAVSAESGYFTNSSATVSVRRLMVRAGDRSVKKRSRCLRSRATNAGRSPQRLMLQRLFDFG